MNGTNGRLIDTVEEFWISDDWASAVSSVSPDVVGQFCRSFVEYLDARDFIAFPCSTGEEALYWALRVAFSYTTRRKVLVCGFNCGVVFRAVEAAGGEPIKFDRPTPERYADVLHDLIVQAKPAVVVVTHFFGAPEDFSGLIEFARSQGVFLLEDCAHCLGGEIGARTAGTLADASIFSFNYDKPISLLGGGMLLLAATHAQRLAAVGYETGGLHAARQSYEWIAISLLRYWLHWRRNPFGARGFVNRLSMRFLGKWLIKFNRSIPLGPIRASLGLTLLHRYRQVLETRRKNEANIRLRGDASGWRYPTTVKPAWLKQKAGPFDSAALMRIEQAARDQRIRLGNYNWPDSRDTDLNCNLENMNYARYWLDIPVHQNLSVSNLVEINRILDETEG